eukprot:366371-Chlamydomonas_euryale.AAC.6
MGGAKDGGELGGVVAAVRKHDARSALSALMRLHATSPWALTGLLEASVDEKGRSLLQLAVEKGVDEVVQLVSVGRCGVLSARAHRDDLHHTQGSVTPWRVMYLGRPGQWLPRCTTDPLSVAARSEVLSCNV